MQTGLTLSELAAQIQATKELKLDMIVETPSIAMQIDSDGVPMLEVPPINSVKDHATRFGIRPTAHDQIGSRLGIPAKYYDRMLAERPELLADNVNAWFRHKPETRMVRTIGGDTRAFLSNRYQRIENEHLLAAAMPALAEIPEAQVVSSGLTERKMYLQVVSPRLVGEVKKGDVVQAGVAIANSEIGHGSYSALPLIWRLACLNGMVSQEGGFRGYHVGKQIDDSEALWAEDTIQADDKAILLKFRDMVRAAVDEARFKSRLEKMQGLADAKVIGKVEKAVEILAAKVSANEAETDGILRALIEGGDLTAWGMINAVTAQGHDKAISYDRAVEFEAAGGALVELAPAEWRRVLEAA